MRTMAAQRDWCSGSATRKAIHMPRVPKNLGLRCNSQMPNDLQQKWLCGAALCTSPRIHQNDEADTLASP
jgi:hypothetical protein